MQKYGRKKHTTPLRTQIKNGKECTKQLLTSALFNANHVEKSKFGESNFKIQGEGFGLSAPKFTALSSSFSKDKKFKFDKTLKHIKPGWKAVEEVTNKLFKQI